MLWGLMLPDFTSAIESSNLCAFAGDRNYNNMVESGLQIAVLSRTSVR